MPDKIRFTANDRDRLAKEIDQTAKDRLANRKARGFDRQWDEIERQIRLEAKRPKPRDHDPRDYAWMSAIEPPGQANAREVLLADSTRLLFPNSGEWYTAHVEITEKWIEAFQGVTVIGPDGTEQDIEPDQETANIIVHGLIDHFHRAYDYRAKWDLMIGSALSHGTFAARALSVRRDVFTTDWRGTFTETKTIPVLAPIPIRNYLLDDSAEFALHEGVELRPTPIRRYWQHERNLRRAAKQATKTDGWFKDVVRNLEAPKGAKEKKDHIELLEMEGDQFFTRTKTDDVYVPDVVVTVALGAGGPKIVRWQDQKYPFGSYIHGVYQQEDMETPYGSSPLMKGQPLQEFLAEMINQTADSGILRVAPPITYDADDTDMIAKGGPVIQPWRQIASKNPDAIKAIQLGDPDALANLVILTIKMFEDQTGVNDPRRGGELKSHTTAFASDIGESRGVLRTSKFVNRLEMGPLRNWLYMLYEMGKDSLGDGQSIFINARGVVGYLKLTKSLLPKRVSFDVHGSLGVLSKRESAAMKSELLNLLAQIQPMVVQLAQSGAGEQAAGLVDLWVEVAKERGLVDPERFAPKPAAANQ